MTSDTSISRETQFAIDNYNEIKHPLGKELITRHESKWLDEMPENKYQIYKELSEYSVQHDDPRMLYLLSCRYNYLKHHFMFPLWFYPSNSWIPTIFYFASFSVFITGIMLPLACAVVTSKNTALRAWYYLSGFLFPMIFVNVTICIFDMCIQASAQRKKILKGYFFLLGQIIYLGFTTGVWIFNDLPVVSILYIAYWILMIILILCYKKLTQLGTKVILTSLEEPIVPLT